MTAGAESAGVLDDAPEIYPSRRAASTTISRVRPRTPVRLFKTRSAVAVETPAARATSFSVKRIPSKLPRVCDRHSHICMAGIRFNAMQRAEVSTSCWFPLQHLSALAIILSARRSCKWRGATSWLAHFLWRGGWPGTKTRNAPSDLAQDQLPHLVEGA